MINTILNQEVGMIQKPTVKIEEVDYVVLMN